MLQHCCMPVCLVAVGTGSFALALLCLWVEVEGWMDG